MAPGIGICTLLATFSVCSTAYYVPPAFSWGSTSSFSFAKFSVSTKTTGAVLSQTQSAYIASPLSTHGTASGTQFAGTLARATAVSTGAVGASSQSGGTYTGDVRKYRGILRSKASWESPKLSARFDKRDHIR